MRFRLFMITAFLLVPLGFGVKSLASNTQAQLPPSSAAQEAPPSPDQAPPSDQMPPPLGEQSPSGRPPEPPWMKELNLSSEQQTKIRSLHEQFGEKTKELRQQFQEADKKLRDSLTSDASADQLRQQYQQVQKLRQQMDDQMFEMRLAERDVFTPAQRTQLAKWMQQHRPQPPKH
jgi:protein CpxP